MSENGVIHSNTVYPQTAIRKMMMTILRELGSPYFQTKGRGKSRLGWGESGHSSQEMRWIVFFPSTGVKFHIKSIMDHPYQSKFQSISLFSRDYMGSYGIMPKSIIFNNHPWTGASMDINQRHPPRCFGAGLASAFHSTWQKQLGGLKPFLARGDG